MDGASDTVAIGIQLGASALLVTVMALVHGLGLVAISRILGLNPDQLEERPFDWRGAMLMGGIALLLFFLHLVEIGLFAGFYIGVGALGHLEEALHYSASSYATLGQGAEYPSYEWRLVGAIESLIGFLLIGWSTAFIVSKVDKLRS
jgi:hypothetical protein